MLEIVLSLGFIPKRTLKQGGAIVIYGDAKVSTGNKQPQMQAEGSDGLVKNLKIYICQR